MWASSSLDPCHRSRGSNNHASGNAARRSCLLFIRNQRASDGSSRRRPPRVQTPMPGLYFPPYAPFTRPTRQTLRGQTKLPRTRPALSGEALARCAHAEGQGEPHVPHAPAARLVPPLSRSVGARGYFSFFGYLDAVTSQVWLTPVVFLPPWLLDYTRFGVRCPPRRFFRPHPFPVPST